MYQFEYQYQMEAEAPVVACIVPKEWLALGLPEMGGWLTYRSNQEEADLRTDFTFEFSEILDPGSLERNFALKVSTRLRFQSECDWLNVLGKTIRIRHSTSESQAISAAPPVELVLVNHLLCMFAGSSLTGMSWVDINDLLGWLSYNQNLLFEYEIGNDPIQTIQIIIDRLGHHNPDDSYSVMFGKMGAVRMAHVDELIGNLGAFSYAPAVNQDEFIVSVLVSDKRVT